MIISYSIQTNIQKIKIKTRKLFDVIFQCIEHKIKNYNIKVRLINYCIFTIILPSSAVSSALEIFGFDPRVMGCCLCLSAAWFHALLAAAQFGKELYRRKGLEIVPVYDENGKVIGTDVVPLIKKEIDPDVVIEKPIIKMHLIVPPEYESDERVCISYDSYYWNAVKAVVLVGLAFLIKDW